MLLLYKDLQNHNLFPIYLNLFSVYKWNFTLRVSNIILICSIYKLFHLNSPFSDCILTFVNQILPCFLFHSVSFLNVPVYVSIHMDVCILHSGFLKEKLML